ncbi:MAG: hypothetical protein AAF961_11040, partial [Planctomycetota bacterium]
TWRWRWRNDERYFARYWGQSVRRLARGRFRGRDATLTTDRAVYRLGDEIRIQAQLGLTSAPTGASLPIELGGRRTPSQEVALTRSDSGQRRYQAVLRDLPADQYSIRLMPEDGEQSAVTAEFEVQAPPGELTRLVADSEAMKVAAERTGGEAYAVDSAASLLNDLPPPRPVPRERLPDRPLLNNSMLMALLCLTLGCEWFLRRRAGMM